MEISNKLEMNKFIEENPGSIQFPLIADLYLNDKDFKKAEEICTNGLKHHPNHPDGLFILVPDITIDEARPWYPTGICSQFGNNAFLGSLNIFPTFIA